ncbi:3'-5' exoribonuclease 1 [Manacus candei]|nr:3'-5' exoribonuclease 1 [Manacus candei]
MRCLSSVFPVTRAELAESCRDPKPRRDCRAKAQEERGRSTRRRRCCGGVGPGADGTAGKRRPGAGGAGRRVRGAVRVSPRRRWRRPRRCSSTAQGRAPRSPGRRPAVVPAAAAMEERKENRPEAAPDEAPAPPAPAACSPGRQHCRINDQETNGKTSTASSNDFSDPVYKEIAITNGYINRMTREELRSKLAEFKLETRGVKDVLKKRLKNYYKKQKLMQKEQISGQSCYDYICVVDFEATCEEGNPPEFVHEIIEFPVVLVNTHTLEIEDSFQQYVKPEVNPKLSNFCINLTGITQDVVDKADTFPQVLQNVVEWMRQRELGTKYSYSMLTDGSWDMSKFLNIQCRVSRIKYPSFAKKWINIRKSYGNFYKVPRNQTKLTIMLEKLGMNYDGRPHSGLDDSKNIARIAIRMLQDGCDLRVNERIHGGQLMTVSSSAPLEGAPAPQMPRYRN